MLAWMFAFFLQVCVTLLHVDLLFWGSYSAGATLCTIGHLSTSKQGNLPSKIDQGRVGSKDSCHMGGEVCDTRLVATR